MPGRGGRRRNTRRPNVTMKRLISTPTRPNPITRNPLQIGTMFREDALGTVWPLVK